jgi:hypothetical protein
VPCSTQAPSIPDRLVLKLMLLMVVQAHRLVSYARHLHAFRCSLFRSLASVRSVKGMWQSYIASARTCTHVCISQTPQPTCKASLTRPVSSRLARDIRKVGSLLWSC